MRRGRKRRPRETTEWNRNINMGRTKRTRFTTRWWFVNKNFLDPFRFSSLFFFFPRHTFFPHQNAPFPFPVPLIRKIIFSKKKKKKKRKTTRKMTAMDPWRNNYPPWYTQNKPGEERTRAAILLSKFRRRGLARSISILK